MNRRSGGQNPLQLFPKLLGMAGQIDHAQAVRLGGHSLRKCWPIEDFIRLWQVIVYPPDLAEQLSRIRGNFAQFVRVKSIRQGSRFSKGRLRGGTEDKASAIIGCQFAKDIKCRLQEMRRESLHLIKDDNRAGNPVQLPALARAA